MRVAHFQQDGFIYFFQETGDGPIKIGHARSRAKVKTRLYDVQIGNPRAIDYIGLTPGTVGDEQALHATFRAEHIRGEWFKPTERLLAHIKANARA